MEKFGSAGQATAYRMPHVQRMLDTKGYEETLGIRTYCFSTAIMVERTRIELTLYVHCLSFILTKLA